MEAARVYLHLGLLNKYMKEGNISYVLVHMRFDLRLRILRPIKDQLIFIIFDI